MAFDTAETLLADAQLEGELVAALALDPAAVELVPRRAVPRGLHHRGPGHRLCGRPRRHPFRLPRNRPGAGPRRGRPPARRAARGASACPALPLLARKLTDLSAGKVSLAEALASFSAAANAGVEAATPAHPLRPAGAIVADVLADARARLEHRAVTGSSVMGLRTGLERLDELIGGLEGGTLTVLLARPNIGKTTLCNGWAYHVAKAGASMLYLSFENPPDDLIRKHLVRIAGVSALDVMRGRADPNQLASAAEVFSRDVGDRLYYVPGTATTNTAAVATLAHRIRKRHPDAPAPLIVLDYLQKLATRPSDDGPRGAGYDDLRGNVARVTQELRDLARTLNAPVLAVSSVNRAAYATTEARPTAASAKESGSIEFDADVVLALADEKDEGAGLAPGLKGVKLDVLKNRYGPTGGINLVFNGAQGRFDPRESIVTIGGHRAAR